MAVKTKDLKAEVLEWLRNGYEDDPECGTQSASELAETFGESPETVLAVLKELDTENKVRVSSTRRNEIHNEYEPIHRGFKW